MGIEIAISNFRICQRNEYYKLYDKRDYDLTAIRHHDASRGFYGSVMRDFVDR